MKNTEKTHNIELCIQNLKSQIKNWRLIAIGVIFFFGLGTAYSLDKTEVEIAEKAKERIEEVKVRMEELLSEAEEDAAVVGIVVKKFCYHVGKIEHCILHLNPSRNTYTLNYGAAAALCAAYDTELCALDEMEEAQEKGAEWCSWGWVKETRSFNETGDVHGSLALPMQSARRGCPEEGLNIQRDVHVLKRAAGANCCISSAGR